ncbi:hypothetical protein GSN00_02145 [Cylindrospermopsis raciborskii CHAB3438]|nr:hypothetical protein [Cylindrospermopsis raciborskii CHAB3438]
MRRWHFLHCLKPSGFRAFRRFSCEADAIKALSKLSKQFKYHKINESGDDGIDGVIDQDALGLDRVYIQAKRYAPGNSIGSGAIRDFFGSLDRHKANKGLFVTTSSFSSSAKETIEFLTHIPHPQLSGREITEIKNQS